MQSNVNLDAHLSALLFLASAALLAVMLLGIPGVAIWRRTWLRNAVSALAALLVGYGVLLLAFSVCSREHTLAQGEEKYFCELDCHLAYSVQKVERVKQISNVAANGEFYIVTIRSRFDETTTASWRPRDVPLTPNPLTFTIVDGRGLALRRSAAGQRAWDATHATHSLSEPLRPGETYETALVFDVPTDVNAPRLLASFAVFPTQVLIGDKNSLLHKKTYFAM